jgi:hypothetical protein
MYRRIYLFFLLTSCMLSAQNHTISGYIEDAASGERIIGVNVFAAGTNYGISSNTYGFYSLTLPEGQYNLVVSFIGYQNIEQSIDLKADTSLDFTLHEDVQQLDEVEVTAEELPAEQVRMSTINLKVADIKKIPAFMGEVDIIRAIQLLPGVQSGSEGTTGFYVRGGSPDQNLILLDGVPVYNASHLFGFFSVFNADAIKNVQLTKGGFPARYGGRLSSVLEIDMKEGNMKEFHGEGSIGLIASKLTLEGPIVKDKTSFIVSGRRTYIDLITAPILSAVDGYRAGYYFGDINAKINHVFSRKDRLYLSYYGGNDKFYYRERYGSSFGNYEEITESNLEWGNHTASLRWNHLFSNKLFGNLNATFTQYKFNTGFSDQVTGGTEDENYFSGFEYFSRIRDYGLRYDFEYRLNSKHNLRFGASYTYHIFNPGASQFLEEFDGISLDSIQEFSKPVFANDFFIYGEDDYQISDRWRANYGLHFSGYFLKDAFYNSLQPRLGLRYMISDSWSLKGSYAYMNQFIHLLSNTGIGLPTDLWVSSTANVKPQLSQQIALGSTRSFAGNRFEFSTEVYYKWMENLIEYKEGASFVTSSDWENQVETDGKGWAYGLEVLLRKNKGKTTGWIGYTLAWSNRQFENLNDGEIFPYRYDRRHDVSIVLNHEFNEQFDVGLTWVFGSGNSFTAPIGNMLLPSNFDPDFPSQFQIYSDRNSQRMPNYHRLDLGINFHKKTKWGQRTWNFSIYNAYSRLNPFFLYINEDFNGNKEVRQVSLFPIIPSIAYIFKF